MTAPEIQQEIERTQDHLGETVEELAARADVKARARARAAIIKDKAAEMKVRAQGRPPRCPGNCAKASWSRVTRCGAAGRLAAAAAGVVLVGSVLVRRRRRRA